MISRARLKTAVPPRWHVLLNHTDLARFSCTICALRKSGFRPTVLLPLLGFVEGYASAASIRAVRQLPDVMQVEAAEPQQ